MIKTIIKIMVAAMVAMGASCVLIMHGASDNAVICSFFCTAIMAAAALGVFDSADKSASEEGRVKSKECNATLSKREFPNGRRNYGQAA